MKKNLSTCIEIINPYGDTIMYANIEEAMSATGLTKRQLEQRATKEQAVKDWHYKWCDPSTRRSYIGRKSRRKGNKWELEIINALKEIGYTGCVSSRSESKRTDDAKVDIVDLNGQLPCHIQAKNTKTMPNFHKIESECPLKDKPFVIAVKMEGKTPLAVLPLEFFYNLITLKK